MSELLTTGALSAFLQVIMIDLVLAGDNAVVIGLAAAGLPKEQRNKAILVAGRCVMPRKLRCAIYTRKSTEEGLEQGFNSLHAQREACEAYILSQAGEGWTALATIYDDGGFSGGNTDRPALKQLLADIARQAIDIVVVYKVDRLTRSLSDFARIVEIFDKANVSFVSVTQAFNTTNSMGRLTLNVLLSFAQFERAVTGERIRDKIAASKAKGVWMGGGVPLGYDPPTGRDRSLVVNDAEAATVRLVFERYLALGSVRKLVVDLRHRGVTTKARTGGRLSRLHRSSRTVGAKRGARRPILKPGGAFRRWPFADSGNVGFGAV